MLNVSNDYKTALTQPRTIDAKIIVGANTITSDDINQIKRSFNTSLFKTIAKMVEIDSNTSITKGASIEPQFGVYLGNAFEYVSLGNYKVKDDTTLKKDTNSYEIVAYDKIIESMVDYELTTSDITYPCTVRDLYVAIFTKLGWATTGIPNSFVNSTSQIEEDVYSNANMTYRDVLDELCTICCMFLIDDSGAPKLIQYTTTNETINEDYMSDTSVEVKDYIFFNSLVFSRASDSDNIYRQDTTSITNNGLHEFKVSDLQILSLNWRDNFIDDMWAYLQTFNYYAFDINTIGITFLEPADLITISTFNNTYSTILLNSDLTIGNGANEKIYSNAPQETKTEYKYADTTDRKINQTNLIVDKQNGQISTLVSSVNNLDTRENNNYQEISNKFENYALQSDIVSIENSVSQLQTDTYTKTEINTKLTDGSVTKVQTMSGTFDENGMRYEKTNAKTSTLINQVGIEVDSTANNEELLFAGFDENINQSIVRTENLTVRRYLVIGENSRIEDFENGGGIFIL